MNTSYDIEDKEKIKVWIDSSIKAADKLLMRIGKISDGMFKSGNLNIFFSLLSRFSYLDYQNILLLGSQYPHAVDIASPSVWKSKAYKGETFIKEEFQGKGINLLVPFTMVKEEKLVWFVVRMYDISQTTVIDRTYTKSPYMVNKKEHIDNLLKSIRIFTSNEFEISYMVLNTEEHKRMGINCLAKNKVIYISPKADELEQLSYIIEYIIKTNTDDIYEQELLNYLARSVRDCLFDIWNLNRRPSGAPPYETIIAVPSQIQKLFLEKAQYWVRSFEDCILHEYLERAKNEDIVYGDIL